MTRTILSSLAVAIFALVLDLAGQTTPSQAATCNCVPVVSRCGAGMSCKFGGCGPPSPGSNVIGRCAATGGGGKKNLPGSYTAEPGPRGAKTIQRRQQP